MTRMARTLIVFAAGMLLAAVALAQLKEGQASGGTPGKAFAGTITVSSGSSTAKDFQLDGAFSAKLK